jgi:hypothetical protein
MKNIIYLSGYARSGKTSLLNELKVNHGWQVLSTSDYLTKETLIYFDQKVNDYHQELFANKDPEYNQYFIDNYGFSLRDAKIHVAEEVIVPLMGRYEGLVQPTIKDMDIDANYTICEVFNLEELLGWQKALSSDYREYAINIRRKDELIGVDSRELFGKRFDNNSGIKTLTQKVLKHVG